MTGMATVVAFHAHPDDEVLLTGGTLARLAAEGHRTVVVVACCGGLGADPETRLAELRVSAARLSVAQRVHGGSNEGLELFARAVLAEARGRRGHRRRSRRAMDPLPQIA